VRSLGLIPVAGMIPAVLHCLLGCCADICCHSADIHHGFVANLQRDPLHPLLLDALRHVWSPAQRGLRFRDPVLWQVEL
jgi:hypothetical protein